MKKILYPDMYVDKLKDIPLVKLREQGIEGLILDLDNTVTGWNRLTVDDEVLRWVNQARDMEFRMCLVSNNGEPRISPVAEILDIPYVSKAGKPRRRAYDQALGVLDLSPDRVAAIGDQIFTDVVGGNRSGLFTILVTPLDKVEFIGTRFMRILERLVLHRLPRG